MPCSNKHLLLYTSLWPVMGLSWAELSSAGLTGMVVVSGGVAILDGLSHRSNASPAASGLNWHCLVYIILQQGSLSHKLTEKQ